MTKVRNLRIDPPAQCNLHSGYDLIQIALGRGVTMA
jgi:hypothetical protein